MKKLVFLFIAVCLVQQVQAQKVNAPGIIITQRDTVKVFFRLPVMDNGRLKYADLQYAITVYKSETDTLSVRLTAAQALQIEFDYQGKRVKMASTNNYVGYRNGFVKPDLIFLKIVEQGRATLCSYYDPQRTTSLQDYSAKHYYVLYQRGKTYLQVGEKESHLAITSFFEDCPRLKNLPSYAVPFRKIPYWVREYNKGNCAMEKKKPLLKGKG